MQRLRELSWTEDQTIAIEFRWADGHNERITEIAAEFVRLKVDVIVTYGNTPALAAKRAVTAIPIVFAAAGDPVGTGLSIRWPGRAETLPACRSSKLISLASVSKSCASFFPGFAH